MYVIINNKIEHVEGNRFYTSLKQATIAWQKNQKGTNTIKNSIKNIIKHIVK